MGVALLALLDRANGAWDGTTTDLLQAIRPPDKPPHGWPETARALAGRLKRLTPALAAGGVQLDRDRTGHDRTRRLTLRKVPENIVRTVRNGLSADGPGVSDPRSADDADGADGLTRPMSEEA